MVEGPTSGYRDQSNSECIENRIAVRLVGEKVHGQKENSPDRQIRSQNVC